MLRRLFLKSLAAVPFLPAFAAIPSTRSRANAATAPAITNMPTISVNGVNLCYEEAVQELRSCGCMNLVATDALGSRKFVISLGFTA
jgi:hypothetical protein